MTIASLFSTALDANDETTVRPIGYMYAAHLWALLLAATFDDAACARQVLAAGLDAPGVDEQLHAEALRAAGLLVIVRALGGQPGRCASGSARVPTVNVAL